jgi:small-conductance mechanosensitive channel
MEQPEYKPDNAPLPEVPKYKLKKGSIEPDVPEHEGKKEEKRNWAWVSTYVIVLIVIGIMEYIITHDFLPINKNVSVWVEKLLRAGMFSLMFLAAGKLLDALVISRLEHGYIRYNLRRVLNLVTFILTAVCVVSILFVNWYAAFVSLGLISLILGFALQTPITSFIGWIYLLIKRPYVIGDRVQIDTFNGDVVDIGYLDTTLWEFGGDYLSTDHPSGRLIKVPNSMVLSVPVFNYTWSYFPYIWNEVRVYISFMSDLKQVKQIMEETAARIIGDSMAERVDTFKDLLADSPIDTLTVNEKPSVIFLTDENTWLVAVVRYLVEPRRAGHFKSIMTQEIVSALNNENVVAVLPKGDSR